MSEKNAMAKPTVEPHSNGSPQPDVTDAGRAIVEMPPEEPVKVEDTPYCEPADLYESATESLQKIAASRKRPLFALVSLFIDDEDVERVYAWRSELRQIAKDGNGLDVLIHSPGGDLSQCYKIARLFSSFLDSWTVLVPRLAASGATLISLGSEKIIMPDVAQLGPLDPQVISKNQRKFFIGERQSPLEAFQAVKYLREFTLSSVDAGMTFFTKRQVTPQLSLETANELAAQLARPILEKIEPYDLGAFALDSNLALEYCRRMCEPEDPAKKPQRKAKYTSLVEKYPSHDFVIDAREAKAIGLNVDPPEIELEDAFDDLSSVLMEFELHHNPRHPPHYIGVVPKAVAVE